MVTKRYEGTGNVALSLSLTKIHMVTKPIKNIAAKQPCLSLTKIHMVTKLFALMIT